VSRPRREAACRWIARWLPHKEADEGKEPIDTVEPPAALNATATGQVLTSFPKLRGSCDCITVEAEGNTCPM